MFDIPVLTITGNVVFDFFFSLNFFFGLLAIGPAQVFKLFRY